MFFRPHYSMKRSPLEAAITATESMVDAAARNRILEEIAKSRFRLGHLADALRGIENMPNEKTVLRQLAIDAANKNDADSVSVILRRLIALDDGAAPLAGRLAMLLLDKKNPDGAMEIIGNIEQPFESDRARYDYIGKLLEHDRFDDAEKLTATFKDAAFRDWAVLTFAKRYVTLEHFDKVEATVARLSTTEKRAWAFLECSRLAPKQPYLCHAATILETLDVDKTNAEAVAIQRRIVGKALWNADDPEKARQLLESSEAALSLIETPFNRLRAQYFLARILRNIGEIDSVRRYLDISVLTATSLTPIQRSELLQWLAEASGNTDDWTLAVQAAADEKDEIRRSRRVVDVLRRLTHGNKQSATGDPDRDAILLSGEEF